MSGKLYEQEQQGNGTRLQDDHRPVRRSCERVHHLGKPDMSHVTNSDPVLRLCLPYIMDNLHNSGLNLQLVAKEVNLGRSSFSKLFNQKIGMSFPQYLTGLRLKKAADLLKTTNLQISEIAFKTGFESGSYFNRIFKQQVSLSPKEYRKRKKS